MPPSPPPPPVPADLHQLAAQLRQRDMLADEGAVMFSFVPHDSPQPRQRWVLRQNGEPKLFVKLAQSEEDAAGLQREFQALLLVRTHLKTSPLRQNLPNAVFMGRVGNHWAQVQLALPGEALGGSFYPGGFGLRRRARAVAFLKVLPQVLGQLHQPLRAAGPPPGVTPPPGLTPAAAALVNQSAQALAALGPAVVGGTHGDFGPHNLLHTHNSTFILDWEDYEAGGVQVYDLFHLFTTAAAGSQHHWALALKPGQEARRAAVTPGRVADWLFRRQSFLRLFALGLNTYATQTGQQAAALGSLYPAYLCAMFWREAQRHGPDDPRPQQWRMMLEHLARAKYSPVSLP